MTIHLATKHEKERHRGRLGRTRIKSDGSMTAEQKADKRAMLAKYPGAVIEDWSTGTFRLGVKVSSFKRIAADGTCALEYYRNPRR